MKLSLTFSSLLILFSTFSTHLSAYPIAGSTPDQRPEGAPVIKEFKKSVDWYAHSLTGVDQPYPASLSFLEDQGAWHNPFTQPGMTGPYDIRNWHQK